MAFQGKVVCITGGASGIGLATAHLLASRGATVAIADSQPELLATAAADIKKANPSVQVTTKVVDVVQSSAVNSWLDEVLLAHHKIDGAANMAGISGKRTPFEDIQEADWDRVINVNLKGIFNCVQAQVKRMKEAGGSIVNAASIAGLAGAQTLVPYCASKVNDLEIIQILFTSDVEFRTCTEREGCPDLISLVSGLLRLHILKSTS